jgi:hypothetical protein
MKNIGMFYGSTVTAVEAYRKHSQQANNDARDYGKVTVNPKMMTITFDDDIRYMYYGFDKDGDAQSRVQGIPFQAIFSENLHPKDKQYVMTRFRPRFDK